MDLRAVKAANRPELLACATAAAENGQDLLDDAELLHDAGRRARAYSLAVLAVEEFGKTLNLLALAAMPKNLKAQAPVRRMLEWHQLKQIEGLLMAVVPLSEPGVASDALGPGPWYSGVTIVTSPSFISPAQPWSWPGRFTGWLGGHSRGCRRTCRG
jgi:hypothetical protein